jgi:hypothetical protein
MFVVSVVCCQVEMVTRQRGVLPTEARRCVRSRNLVKRGGHSLRWAAEPQKINTVITIINNTVV